MNDYSTSAHDALSDVGIAQSVDLAERLQEARFDALYCSPSRRAVQTILPSAGAKSRVVEIWPELDEACWQEDRSVNEHEELRFVESESLSDLDSKGFRFRDSRPIRPPEDETYSEGIFRLGKVIELLFERHKGTEDNILIVGHGYSISRLIELLLRIDPISRFKHANTGMSLVTEDDKIFNVQYINRLS